MTDEQNKQALLDRLYECTPVHHEQFSEFLKRGIIVRKGIDLWKNWDWNRERLPFYSYEALEAIMQDLINENNKKEEDAQLQTFSE